MCPGPGTSKQARPSNRLALSGGHRAPAGACWPVPGHPICQVALGAARPGQLGPEMQGRAALRPSGACDLHDRYPTSATLPHSQAVSACSRTRPLLAACRALLNALCEPKYRHARHRRLRQLHQVLVVREENHLRPGGQLRQDRQPRLRP